MEKEEYRPEYWQDKKHHKRVKIGPCELKKQGTVILFHKELTLTVKDKKNSNNINKNNIIIENTYGY